MSDVEGGGVELSELRQQIGAIVEVLAAVRDGEYGARLRAELPEAHPLYALHQGINVLLGLLSHEQERVAQCRHELEDGLALIEMQKAALRELSTPLIEVWAGVLCLPIIGIMEDERSAQMMGDVLAAVQGKRARHVIIDVTGAHEMDSVTLNRFVTMASAVRLLGAECVITGITPPVAQTLATMQIDLRAITTLGSLREALTRILRRPEGHQGA